MSVPFREQAELQLSYKGQTLRKTYQPDFIYFDKIILEIKAVTALADSTAPKSTTTSRRPASDSGCS